MFDLISLLLVVIQHNFTTSLDNFVHSTLPQFTQLYTRVSGYKQWWVYVNG